MPAKLTLVRDTSRPAAATPLPGAPVPDPLREAAITAAFSLDAAVASADSREHAAEQPQATGPAAHAFFHDEGFIAGVIHGYLAAHADQAEADLVENALAAVRSINDAKRKSARKTEQSLKVVRP